MPFLGSLPIAGGQFTRASAADTAIQSHAGRLNSASFRRFLLDLQLPVERFFMIAVVQVLDQFFEAYRTYDMEMMLSLQTDGVVWIWIDPGKNFPQFGPEGRWVGTGKDAIRAMFELDRGSLGFI
jgi:hypothetical protein